MFCSSCGKEIEATVVFCPHCGAATKKAEAPQASAPESQVNMVFCRSCGKKIAENAAHCPHCGAPAQSAQQPMQQQPPAYSAPTMQAPPEDIPSGGLNVLSFFIPLVGLILYLTWKDQTPNKAKAAGKAAIWGFCIGLALQFLFILIGVLGSM